MNILLAPDLREEVKKSASKYFLNKELLENVINGVLETIAISKDDKLNFEKALLKCPDLPEDIARDVRLNFFMFVQFSVMFQYLRKNRLEHLPSNQGFIGEVKEYLNGKMEYICFSIASIPFDFDGFNANQKVMILKETINLNPYLDRDCFYLWLQDICKKHSPENYCTHMLSILRELQPHFPTLFKKPLDFDYGARHGFKSNLCKIRNRLEANSLKIKEMGIATESI